MLVARFALEEMLCKASAPAPRQTEERAIATSISTKVHPPFREGLEWRAVERIMESKVEILTGVGNYFCF